MTQPLALHSVHASGGAQFGERGGQEVVLHQAPGDREYAAATRTVALLDLSARGTLSIRGPDRASFLHGMVTQDIEGLVAEAQTYAAMLTVKGSMVADARVLKRADELLLDVEPGAAATVLAFLNKYLISEDAELAEVSAEHGHLLVLGPLAADVVQDVFGAAPPAPGTFRPVAFPGRAAELLLFHGDPGLRGLELLVPAAELEPVWRALDAAVTARGGCAAGLATLEVLRVEAGVPRFFADMDERTIPLEANLERAIHYQKGCYIGQEVIARATFRGHVNRKLAGLLLGTQTPPARAELRVGERKAGFLTTVVASPAVGQNIALGYVHRDFLAPGTLLELVGGGMATVVALPFVQAPPV